MFVLCVLFAFLEDFGGSRGGFSVIGCALRAGKSSGKPLLLPVQ